MALWLQTEAPTITWGSGTPAEQAKLSPLYKEKPGELGAEQGGQATPHVEPASAKVWRCLVNNLDGKERA